jgi:endoglucanase
MKRRALLAAAPALLQAAPRGASERAQRLARQLDRGINLGNIFDAPAEGDWGLRWDPAWLPLFGEGGFTKALRLPVRWSNHASLDAEARIDAAFFARIDSVVDALLARGCTLLLNLHHYRQLDGDALDKGEHAVAPELVRPRFLAMWQQIAARYADRSERLLFEPYNEPHGTLEPQWNALLAEVHALIRKSNPERVLVVGPTLWNNATHLDRLRLPDDRHLIVTVHHYEPFAFTHQGASWVQPALPLGVDCCSAAQLKAITEPLDIAQRYAQQSGYPVLVGEFGAYGADGRVPDAARARYLRAMRDAMQARGLPWMAWEFASGFGVYDPLKKKFRSEIHQALYGA